MPSQLNLERNCIGGYYDASQNKMICTPEGPKAIADALRVSGSLTAIGEGGLDLRGNHVGEEGWATIIEAVCSSTVSKIASIDASNEGIGPKGAKRIAEALKASVNGSLTSVR